MVVPTGDAGVVLDDDNGGSVMASDLACGMAKLHHARGTLGLAGQEGVHHGIGVARDTGLTAWLETKLRASSREAKSSATKTFSTFTKSAASALGASTAAALGGLDRLSSGGGSCLLVLLEVVLLEGHEQDATDHSADEDREDPQRPFSTTGRTRKPP